MELKKTLRIISITAGIIGCVADLAFNAIVLKETFDNRG